LHVRAGIPRPPLGGLRSGNCRLYDRETIAQLEDHLARSRLSVEWIRVSDFAEARGVTSDAVRAHKDAARFIQLRFEVGNAWVAAFHTTHLGDLAACFPILRPYRARHDVRIADLEHMVSSNRVRITRVALEADILEVTRHPDTGSRVKVVRASNVHKLLLALAAGRRVSVLAQPQLEAAD
jgi:hypothetical protein